MAYCLRRLIGKQTSYIRSIATTPVRMEEALEKLQKNPYFEKYAERIASMQQTSPEEFLKRVQQTHLTQEEEHRKKFASVDTRQYSSVLNPKEELKGEPINEEKKLDAIFKLELVQEKSSEEIQSIWEEYHKHKDVISATIPSDIYKHIQENVTKYPTFIFPLPRSQGYEFILCQSHGNTLHFTPLLAYQVHKENAPECLTAVHYTELRGRGIVLMRGEYDKNVLTGQEARCLANQFQLYYGGHDEERSRLLDKFTREPDSFEHMDLIAQLENITL